MWGWALLGELEGRCPKQLQGTPGPQRHWDCVNSSDIVLELSPFPSTDSLMGKLTNVYWVPTLSLELCAPSATLNKIGRVPVFSFFSSMTSLFQYYLWVRTEYHEHRNNVCAPHSGTQYFLVQKKTKPRTLVVSEIFRNLKGIAR